MSAQHTPGPRFQAVRISANQCRVLLLIKDGPRFTFEIQTYADQRAVRELGARGWLRPPLSGAYTLTQDGLAAARLARSSIAKATGGAA